MNEYLLEVAAALEMEHLEVYKMDLYHSECCFLPVGSYSLDAIDAPYDYMVFDRKSYYIVNRQRDAVPCDYVQTFRGQILYRVVLLRKMRRLLPSRLILEANLGAD